MRSVAMYWLASSGAAAIGSVSGSAFGLAAGLAAALAASAVWTAIVVVLRFMLVQRLRRRPVPAGW